MDIEKSVSKLEKQIDAFRITGDGVAGSFKTGFTIGGTSGGGTGPIKIDEPQPEDHEGRIAVLQKQFKDFRIIGGAGVTAEGSMQHGYAINVQRDEGGGTGGGGGGGGGDVGACCAPDGTCSVMSSASCTSFGGTYQGNGTPCSPNPCAATGACCENDGCDCEIITEAACSAAGGSYLGDGSDCVCCCRPPGAPNSLAINATISSDAYPTSLDCNGEIPIAFSVDLSASVDTSTICFDVSSGTWHANALSDCFDIPTSCISCNTTVCSTVNVDLRAAIDGSNWLINVDVHLMELCGGPVWGGDQTVLDFSLGSNPVGTYTISFDDVNTPEVHYDFTITIA